MPAIARSSHENNQNQTQVFVKRCLRLILNFPYEDKMLNVYSLVLAVELSFECILVNKDQRGAADDLIVTSFLFL